MSRIAGALLSIIETMVDNPASILILVGLVVILIGWMYGEAWVLALGLFVSIAGIIASVGKTR